MIENFEGVCQAAFVEVFKPLVPYTPNDIKLGNGIIRRASTGNMRNSASKVLKTSEREVQIFVDAANAPYVVYTNEPWTSQRWHGKKNPNEKWFDNATLQVAKRLAEMLGGRLVIE